MKGFTFGIVTMMLILALGLLFALKGFVNMRADNPLQRYKQPSPVTPWTQVSRVPRPRRRIP